MIKNNFRILKKPHAYLQTILKAPVKFQKDWPKTVGGVEGTRYLLKIRNHAPRTTHYGKPKTMSLRFSSKRRGTIKRLSTLKAVSLSVLSEHVQHPWAPFRQIAPNFASRERRRLVARNPKLNTYAFFFFFHKSLHTP